MSKGTVSRWSLRLSPSRASQGRMQEMKKPAFSANSQINAEAGRAKGDRGSPLHPRQISQDPLLLSKLPAIGLGPRKSL